MLACDRFYGTQSLLGLCKKPTLSYRIRLKGNLLVQHKGTEISLKEAVTLSLSFGENVILRAVQTYIAALH